VQPDHFDATVFYEVLLHERQDSKARTLAAPRYQISQESFLPYFPRRDLRAEAVAGAEVP
jgi:hypothetical protein